MTLMEKQWGLSLDWDKEALTLLKKPAHPCSIVNLASIGLFIEQSIQHHKQEADGYNRVFEPGEHMRLALTCLQHCLGLGTNW